MSSQSRLSRAFKNAKRVAFDDASKLILFSDCHRGDNSFADDFARNKNIYFHALKYYYKENFIYCELGDGDELWENMSFTDVFQAHKNIYELFALFHEKNRFHLIWGNHDMVYRNPKYVKKYLHSYFDRKTNETKPLLPNLKVEEAIVLEHSGTKQQLFLTHGHQADFMNYVVWRFHKLMVRVFWRPLQVMGVFDPTSPAKNYNETIKLERRVKKWIRNTGKLITIIGHTHRPRYPKHGEIPFFNSGSCVHPRAITGIEITNGEITLVKWQTSTTENGTLRIIREPLEGPCKISDFQ